MKNLIVTKINDFKEIPANSIVITYSDHYRGNSGDNIYFSDNEGRDSNFNDFMNKLQWSTGMDDRHVLSCVVISHINGAFPAYINFRKICNNYVEASNNLKKWEKGETIWNVETDENTLKYGNCGTWKEGTRQCRLFTGSKDNLSFEQSRWFKFAAKRSKNSTIAKKRDIFYKEQIARNEAFLTLLKNQKEEAAKWFIENNISVRNAYIMMSNYIS